MINIFREENVLRDSDSFLHGGLPTQNYSGPCANGLPYFLPFLETSIFKLFVKDQFHLGTDPGILSGITDPDPALYNLK